MDTINSNHQAANLSNSRVKDKSTGEVYLLRSILGEGSFGSIYRGLAEDNQYYAIKKVLKRKDELQEDYEERCDKEINIHKQLRHPNIIELHHSFIGTDTYYYLVLELCRDETLRKYIDTRGGVTDKEARYILISLFSAVLYLQENRIIHRDLKPENILFGFDMTIKICDFNLSTQLGPGEESIKGSCGTMPYMAPEVLRNKEEKYNYKADVWALGIILCELILGFNPFKYSSKNELIKKFNETDLRIHKSLDTLNEDFKNCVKYILNVEQDARPDISQIMNLPYFKRHIPRRLFDPVLCTKPSFGINDVVYLNGSEDHPASIDSSIGTEDINGPDNKKTKLKSFPNTPTADINSPLHTFSISGLSSIDIKQDCSFCSTQGCDMCTLQD